MIHTFFKMEENPYTHQINKCYLQTIELEGPGGEELSDFHPELDWLSVFNFGCLRGFLRNTVYYIL